MSTPSRDAGRDVEAWLNAEREPKERAMLVSLDQQVLERIRAEYLEMPGMKLTADQLRRFCGVEQTVCRPILDALVKTGFLCLRHDGSYVRLTDGGLSLPRSAKTPLKATLVPTTRSRRAS